MLELRNISKDYVTKDITVHALKNLTINLRDAEFVSILGPSGCGKTTTLNIIGGLDQYSSGDLLIEGRTTKKYKDRDWDAYRNHKVGFVFQSYNLIPHQTILSNVELALTIGNVSKSVRKEMAKNALIRVGLEQEINKFPRQLSGGQMQRVAIARAIVNNPSVLLADEPTGALDSKTSIQVLDILKELSKDCLVVMVTHNEELAKRYSTRIITLKDGEMTGDSNPFIPTVEDIEKSLERERNHRSKYITKKGKEKKVSMPFNTALKLSLSNLKSKIGRTILTCFAGSIGIIGIALILSLSTGFNNYVDKVEKSTLSLYPITLSKSTVDLSSIFTSFLEQNQTKQNETNYVEKEIVVPNYVLVDLARSLANNASFNDIQTFKKYIEEKELEKEDYVLEIEYGYNIELNVYSHDYTNAYGEFEAKRLVPLEFPEYDPETGEKLYIYSPQFDTKTLQSFYSSIDVWDQMFEDLDTIKEQYDLVKGAWPTNYNEVVVVVDDNNQISDLLAYEIGLVSNGDEYIAQLFNYVNDPENYEDPRVKFTYEFTYDDLLSLKYYIIPQSKYYIADDVEEGCVQTFTSIKGNVEETTNLIVNSNNALEINVVGILRPNKSSDTHSINGSIGYTKALTDKIIEINNNSEVVKAQEAQEDYAIIDFLGYDQILGTTICKGKTWDDIQRTLKNLNIGISDAVIKQINKTDMLQNMYSSFFGRVDRDNPSSIKIYPKSFEDKEKISDFIDNYNQIVENDDMRVTYNDYLSSIMGSVTTIINAITYVLIAFVSISLVVSSIMIAIITYISVIERTKEIGILRAMGASKSDVKNIFNAETFITGLLSGIIGIVITIILNIPISIIVMNLANISNIAVLPVLGGIILVVISFLLSVISGLIPASYAAKCDPVVALRTE